MYFNCYFNLDDWDSNASYIVFDDIPWDRFKGWWKQFFGAQKEFVLTDKYKKKQKVLWGKPCIYLCNEEANPRDLLYFDSEKQWLDENTITCKINSSLY